LGVSFYFSWEPQLILLLQSNTGAAAQLAAVFFSLLGEKLTLVLIIGFIYWCWDKKMGRFIGVNVISAVLWNTMLKNIFPRRRPYMDSTDIKCLRPAVPSGDPSDLSVQGFSFPSGHAMLTAALFPSAAVYTKKRVLAVLAAALPLLVGLSRVYLGVHYPTDVIVGWIMGAGVAAGLSSVHRRIKKADALYLAVLLTGIPGFFYCTSTDFYSAYGLALGSFAAFAFEERFVRFENTRSPVKMLLRTAGGAAVFLLLSFALKLPFSAEFLAGGSLASRLVRTARYAVIAFADIGLYPMLFSRSERRGRFFAGGAEKCEFTDNSRKVNRFSDYR